MCKKKNKKNKKNHEKLQLVYKCTTKVNWMKKTSRIPRSIDRSQMHKIVQHPSSFPRVVRSFEKVDTLTRPNCLCFKMEQGMSRTDIWKLFEGIVLRLNRLLVLLKKRLIILILLVALDIKSLRKIEH